MGKIIKLNKNGVVIVTKNGNYITASYNELDFSPKIGDGVKIYTKGDSFLIRKLNKNGVSTNKKNFSHKTETEIFKQKLFWIVFISALILANFMTSLIGILSFICVIGGIISLVIRVLKGKTKRNAGAVILASFMIFITAVSVPENDSKNAKKLNSHNPTENSVPMVESTSLAEEKDSTVVVEPLETKVSNEAEVDTVFATENTTVRIGEPLTVGDVTFIAHNTSTATTLSWSTLNEDADGIFLIVEISITNNKKDALRLSIDLFNIINDDRTYKSSYSPTKYANDYDSLTSKLNPGVSTQYKIVFDVPESIIHSPNTHLKVQTGFWGTESGSIQL